MKRVFLGMGITALMLLLLAGAFAFSLTLQNLHVNAMSFSKPAPFALYTEPMTSADEAAISSPDADGVRLEEYQASQRVCSKNKTPDRATDF